MVVPVILCTVSIELTMDECWITTSCNKHKETKMNGSGHKRTQDKDNVKYTVNMTRQDKAMTSEQRKEQNKEEHRDTSTKRKTSTNNKSKITLTHSLIPVSSLSTCFFIAVC